jgi:hypothetical protein
MSAHAPTKTAESDEIVSESAETRTLRVGEAQAIKRPRIRAVGGRARLRADGAHAEGKAIWVIKGNDTTIEGVEFSGAEVPDQNAPASGSKARA